MRTILGRRQASREKIVGLRRVCMFRAWKYFTSCGYLIALYRAIAFLLNSIVDLNAKEHSTCLKSIGRHTKIKASHSRGFILRNFLIYQAKWAKALLASAIRCISSFFLIASPSLFAANLISSASFSAIGRPFLLRAAFMIHRYARASRRF